VKEIPSKREKYPIAQKNRMRSASYTWRGGDRFSFNNSGKQRCGRSGDGGEGMTMTIKSMGMMIVVVMVTMMPAILSTRRRMMAMAMIPPMTQREQ